MSLSKPERHFLDELSCPICLQLFSEPVLLPCGHNFCVSCIEGVIEQESGRGRHACPECQSEYRGRAALQRSFKLCNIVEGYKASQGSGDSEVLCIMCLENPLPAVKTCLKCETSMCSLHLHLHTKKLSFQNHTLVGAILLSCPSRAQMMNQPQSQVPDPAELQSRLDSQMKEIAANLKTIELLLQNGEKTKAAVKATNSELKQKAVGLLDHMVELVKSYRSQVIELIDTEQSLSEESLQGSMHQVAEQQELLKATQLQAQSVLAEQDESVLAQKLAAIETPITEVLKQPLKEPCVAHSNPKSVCYSLQEKHTEFWTEEAKLQRALRALMIPSEVTFDPNTVHPSLLLSEDLRTVTYTTTKQMYPNHPERFSSFFQFLSSQSFTCGKHSWEVEAKDCDWAVGVCYKGVSRTGMASGLESSAVSWCLLWTNNMIWAYGQGKGTSLKKATHLTKVEVALNYETGTVSFHSIRDQRVHLHTFNTTFTEPVHLGFRIVSCRPKAQITVHL
ncbi:E3 ubiquitin-protein ligase TRIM39 [Amia ocellicauda]|uniref:E3 ubiquitin-protein ligase TRIM39 n=1 Tax=Amia ocellicauda TaxID=2972642 RepID=UPI003464E584